MHSKGGVRLVPGESDPLLSASKANEWTREIARGVVWQWRMV